MTTHDQLEWEEATAGRDLDSEFMEAASMEEEIRFRPTRPTACVHVGPDLAGDAAYEQWLMDLPRESCGAWSESDKIIEAPF